MSDHRANSLKALSDENKYIRDVQSVFEYNVQCI